MIILTLFLDHKIFEKTLKYSGYESGNIFIFSDHHQLHYKTALKIFYNNKIFGSGPKQFRYLCSKDEYYTTANDIYSKTYISQLDEVELLRINNLDGCSTHPHHTFIQLLTETGLFGFFIFLVFYFALIFFILKLTKNSNNYNTKMILAFIILINFSPFMPSGNFFNNYLSLVYFIPISILYALISKEKYDRSI